MESSDTSGRGPDDGRGLPLMVVDSLALVAFVVSGAASHHDASFVVVLARNLGPWAVGWVLAAALLGTYRRGSWGSLVRTWALAAPVGLLGRSWLVGEPRGSELLQFLAVGACFSLLYLVIARLVFRAVVRRRTASA